LTAGKVFDALAFAWDNPEVIDADIHRERKALRGVSAPMGGTSGRQMSLPFSPSDD
jgi:hypothetical protein